jgi:hypothetical protein
MIPRCRIAVRNTWAVPLLLLFLFACSKDLTRAKAARLLSQKYPQPVWAFYPIWNEVDFIRALERKGWIVIKGGTIGITHQSFDITPEAANLIQKTKAYGLMEGISAKICEAVFVGITGIKTEDVFGSRAAEVQYKIRYTNPTPVARDKDLQRWFNSDQCLREKELNRRATFVLYDDGWREQE